MPRRKMITWITAMKAAEILSKKINRPVNVRYIRRLGEEGKIDRQFITNRQNLYSKEDIEAFTPGERVGKTRKVTADI